MPSRKKEKVSITVRVNIAKKAAVQKGKRAASRGKSQEDEKYSVEKVVDKR